MKRVLIATPAKGGIPGYYFRFYEEVMAVAIPNCTIKFVVEEGNHAINLARNIIADHAITENYDRLVMLDKDHPLTAKYAVRLLSHDEPIVGGLYCKKRPAKPFWLALKTKGATVRADGLLAADFIATGFLSMDVAALRDMAAKMPERRYIQQDEAGVISERTEFFPIGIVGPNTAEAKLEKIRAMVTETPSAVITARDLKLILDYHEPNSGRLLGEDYHFCHLARRCGVPLYIDTQCVIPHEGNALYPIEPEWVASPSPILEQTPSNNGFNY